MNLKKIGEMLDLSKLWESLSFGAVMAPYQTGRTIEHMLEQTRGEPALQKAKAQAPQIHR